MTMLLKINPNLTGKEEPERMRQLSTYAEMAHFAGTGPDRRCGHCLYWQRGGQKEAECLKYRQLMSGKRGPKVPRGAMACKYFEEHKKKTPLSGPGGAR